MKWLAWLLCLASALAAQTVSGTVSNSLTREPVADATVTLVNLGDARPVSGRTDNRGAFRIPNVEAGDYFVAVSRREFETSRVGGFRVHVEAGSDPDPVSLTLMPWPKLRGRVLDAERQAVKAIAVTAIPLRGGVRTAVTTDADGRYTFPALEPGEYALLANPQESGAREFAPTYFPNAAARADGESVIARPGVDLDGYDIVLRGGPFFRVSGRVVDESGRPAAGAVVQLETPDGSIARTTADQDGAFAMEHVAAVDGHLFAQRMRGEVELQGFQALTVTRHDVENVALRVWPPVSLALTVELDGKPTAPGNSYAVLAPADGVSARFNGASTDRGFRFDDAYPGRYKLFFIPMGSGMRDTYLESVLLGERDITMQEFELAPDLLPVRVILRTGGGTVRGTVDRPEANGRVILVPQDERLRYLPFLAEALFEGGGRFVFANVRPGDYYALAVQGGIHAQDLQEPAMLAPLLPHAVSVRVERGGTVSLQLAYATAGARW